MPRGSYDRQALCAIEVLAVLVGCHSLHDEAQLLVAVRVKFNVRAWMCSACWWLDVLVSADGNKLE